MVIETVPMKGCGTLRRRGMMDEWNDTNRKTEQNRPRIPFQYHPCVPFLLSFLIPSQRRPGRSSNSHPTPFSRHITKSLSTTPTRHNAHITSLEPNIEYPHKAKSTPIPRSTRTVIRRTVERPPFAIGVPIPKTGRATPRTTDSPIRTAKNGSTTDVIGLVCKWDGRRCVMQGCK